MSTVAPERPYTPYQRRCVIVKLSEKDGDIFKATERFKAMELDNAEGLVKLCNNFPKSPAAEEDDE